MLICQGGQVNNDCTILVMGISSTGKSTLAKALAERVSGSYVDADDFHSEAAKRVMQEGESIDQVMRAQWIARLSEYLQHESSGITVLAYSGLIASQRKQLMAASNRAIGLLLTGEPSVIAERMNARKSHFASPNMLTSQLALFEPIAPDENLIFTLAVEDSTEQQLALAINYMIKQGILTHEATN